MSYTNVRKIFCCTGFVAQSIFMFMMTLTTSPTLLIIFVTLAIGFGGMPWSSFGVNHLDIGAGYANVLISVSNTFATLPGIISPVLTGHLIEDKVKYIFLESSFDFETKSKLIVFLKEKSEWNAVFAISAFIYLFGAVIYYLVGTGETQFWAIGSKDLEIQNSTYSNDISRHSTFSISETNASSLDQESRVDENTKETGNKIY